MVIVYRITTLKLWIVFANRAWQNKGEDMANLAWKRASEWVAELEEKRFPALQCSHLPVAGWERGAIANVSGPRSSGRTGMCWAVLAESTCRGEICAVVDWNDAFAPDGAADSGVVLEQVLWIRCGGNFDAALRTTDMLLHAGGFGVVLLDICDANARQLDGMPGSYWFRWQRAIENSPAILLVCSDRAQANAAMRVNLSKPVYRWAGKRPFLLLEGMSNRVALEKKNQKPQVGAVESVAS